MRLAALGILVLAAPCFGASSQANPYQDAHLRNLYVERRLALEKAWAEAGEEDRERVCASARANKTGGQPALYAASAQILTDARFMLAGDEKAVSELSIQSRVACSLDLMVLPGAFGAVDRDRGDALIVRVLPAYTRLYQRALPEQIQLTMIWVSPDGKETRARTEPVHRSALVLPGFEMYFHAPPSKPGTWSLIPEVEWDGVKGRGVPVPIEGVRALFDRYDQLVKQAGPGESERAILASLERILLHGGRDAGIIVRNSRRVASFCLKAPVMRLVTVTELGFITPRVVMHWCRASITTATPRGSSTRSMVSAICTVSFSWICSRRA